MAMLLGERDVISIINAIGINRIMDELCKRLEDGILALADNHVMCPERAGFSYSKPAIGLIEWMPVYDAGHQRVAIKTVGYHPDNPVTKGLPTILSNTALYDVNTGELICIFESTLATAMRTGAASALASKMLAHPESTSFGFIGCGAQAVTQLHALSRMFAIREVYYYDSDPVVQSSFEYRCASLDIDAVFIPSTIDAIVVNCDVITTATTIGVGAGPLFDKLPLKPYVHFNAVGSDFPGKVELPRSLLTKCFVCPDHLEQAQKEGECQQLRPDEIGATLTEVVQSPQKFEALKNTLTVFDSTGWAFEDWVVMDLFMHYAEQLGLSKQFSMHSSTSDVKNPYALVAVQAGATIN